MLYFLISRGITQSIGDILEDVINGLENCCIAFNNFILIFYKYFKFIFVFIILSIGVFTLLRLRGVYRQERLVNSDNKTAIYSLNPKINS